MKYNLIITLKSDLCVADGGVYNSTIDTDVCYDAYGLPYIPAKRIKGCLRECALELLDWGKDIPMEELFGVAGKYTNVGALHIGNAYLKDYDALVSEIEKNKKNAIYHAQNVLGNYSYLRQSTAIDECTGTAKPNSLRTIRVVNEGLVFAAEVTLEKEEYEKELQDICKTLRHIGLNRTRGLGEISASLERNNQNQFDAISAPGGEGVALKYTLSLQEPVICKSPNGGESNSLDYIEASKMLGILANAIKDNNAFKQFISNSDLKITNAYLDINGQRLQEVPANIYAIKNNKEKYINQFYYVGKNDTDKDKGNGIQKNAMKHCYVSMDEEGNLAQYSVKMEERYHHSRPEDKSIGRAIDTDGSKFYQISSIDKGQNFSGYFVGNEETISRVGEYLSQVQRCYIGHGRSAEYGTCLLEVTKDNGIKEKIISGKEFAFVLHAPAIIYNENAMYSTSTDDLLAEIIASLNLDSQFIDKTKTKYFLKYTNVGGYNVTWDEKKPTISALDKGTAVKLVFQEEVSISLDEIPFIGERNLEGYGECSVSVLDETQTEEQWRIIHSEKTGNELEQTAIAVGSLGKSISKDLLYQYIKKEANELAHNNEKLCKQGNRATISNMMLMVKESSSIEEVRECVEDRYNKKNSKKQEKQDIANSILKLVEKHTSSGDGESILEKFCGDFNILPSSLDNIADEIPMILLESLLIELKYRVRGTFGKEKGENNGE